MIGRPLCHLLADCSDEVPYSPIPYSGQPTMEDGSVVRVKSFSPLTCRPKTRHLTILLEHIVCASLLLFAQPGNAMEPCAMDENDKTLVILGASYSKGWTISSVNGYAVTNQGVGGNQSFEMLARFQKDVIDLRPDVVTIWGLIYDMFRASPGQLKSAKERIKRSFEEMVDLFDIKDVYQSASSFNPEKLLWINQQHIIATPVNKLGKALTPFLSAG